MISRVGKFLLDTFANPELQSVAAELGEVFLDRSTAEGVIKEIPIIGSVASLARAGLTIHNRLFENKVRRFLFELDTVPPEELESMIASLEESGQSRTEVGEKLLYILDACEDQSAAAIVGKLFVSYLQRKLTYDEFVRASRASRMVGTEDFTTFIRTQEGSWSLEEAGEFVAAGLLYFCEPELELGRQRHTGSMVRGMKPMVAKSSSLGSKIRDVLGPAITKPAPT